MPDPITAIAGADMAALSTLVSWIVSGTGVATAGRAVKLVLGAMSTWRENDLKMRERVALADIAQRDEVKKAELAERAAEREARERGIDNARAERSEEREERRESTAALTRAVAAIEANTEVDRQILESIGRVLEELRELREPARADAPTPLRPPAPRHDTPTTGRRR